MKNVLLAIIMIFLLIFSIRYAKAQDATGEANSIREKVKEKVEAAKKSARAYIGFATDKTEDTLQIQNDLGEIQLISIDSENASFAKIDKKTVKTTYDDIGIGDYIIAMGFENGNGVLDAKRIVVTSKPDAPQKKVVMGNVVEVNKKQVTLNSVEGEFTLEFPTRWKGPEISDLEEGTQLIAVGEMEDNIINIRTIHIATQSPKTPSE